ncbi:uncharacterized protein LOC131615243 [Vicia villosa]|uniref:uncharacterized protein LOC131615243 n=1 Tax=Vicia villosa TaxID=3911 RepID=UPI00273AE85A|nr:uncharacterized protein LOC131615243 [Vicia villosa]
MEWHQVQRKELRNLVTWWDSFPYGRIQAGQEETISTFYCLEFPERCRAVDLFKIFGCVGDVVEVVIPPRRNRFGKRFGFARFKNVEDEKFLAIKLDNILIDGKKIHVNQPRYSRKEVRRKSEAWPREEVSKKQNVLPRNNFVQMNKSFADGVLKVKKFEDKEIASGFRFNTSAEVKNKWRKAFIGEVLFAGETYNIQTHLEIEGFFFIKVHPLGANLCLLEELEEGVIQELINEASSLWKQWFKSIRPWQEKDIDSERVMWVRVYGIPCHACCFEFFESVANMLGTYICVDENTMSGDNMDIARILIRVPSSFSLKDHVEVNVDGDVFQLVLHEDTYGPVRLVATSPTPRPFHKKSSLSSSNSGEIGFSYHKD